ncbi:MAG: 5-formyltetrahydrofolate cyclo-ligase, partial [Bacteroidales bacterium]|nr:5-formyltetrahydrofolate cyclo-ligase [Bacteroidales bacterium]
HKIGVCFQFQYLDTVPSEAHDVCMDSIACGG